LEGLVDKSSVLIANAPLTAANPPVTTLERTATGTGKDLTNLDLLRSVAVCSVVVSHIFAATYHQPPAVFMGSFGVGLFFVHTALVLMWSLERRPNTLDFYLRRIARIYPLAIVAVLFVVLTHAPVATYKPNDIFFHYLAPTHKQLGTHLLLVQNLFSDNFILYPMWSLPIEVQMYLLLPVVFFYLRKNMSLWPLLLFWMLAAAFAHKCFGFGVVNLAVSIPYFLPGIMAYVGFCRRKAVLPGWSFVLALAIIVWFGGHSHDWQPAWFPCLALGLILPSFRQLRESFLTKACWQIARYSYGMYLLHPFSLVLAFYLCRNFPWPVQFGVLFGSLALLSVAAFHLIEAPFMMLGAKVANAAARRFKMPTADDCA
jgi:peptidoglycan/LPS O-acetylase OafA/YrhL